MADLRVESADGVATLTLDRPDALNALTVGLKESLRAALDELGRDDSVRAIVLTGAGRAFCAGQDLRERLEPDALPLADEIRARYNPLALAMLRLPKPIIGAINGVAAGAGASLAFACDLRIAAESASFVLAFGRIGLLPDTAATWLLPRLVGSARAVELALLNEPLHARAAEAVGLVMRVVPDDQLAAEAHAVARRLADGAPLAMAATKAALVGAWDVDLDTQLETEARLQ
ncbi:MAG TPA: enoyl-CoA hydratase-related protein, partial [Candidatus Limnocylindrales bacterium]|nr:enoyl-CoA hydratase-related protein [Candidatus Limnocylindrales bacterium]